MRRAMIVCTLGPATNSQEMLEKLINAGMDVARLNFSHGTHADHLTTIDKLRAAQLKVRKAVETVVIELWFGDHLAASRLTIESDRTIATLKTTYDESMKRIAPRPIDAALPN